MHSNFLGFYGRLLAFTEKQKSSFDIETLIKEISATNNVLAKQWLADNAGKFVK